MLTLAAGDYRLELAPERGGSILRFDWRGQPIFRPACGPGIFDVASFPLVPFSNRIAHGRFRAKGREVVLAPNFPGLDHPHTLHGFGWKAAWQVIGHSDRRATVQHAYSGGEWPWPYLAEQQLLLDEDGLTMTLSVTNCANDPMPAGLGFHPYFLRDPDTIYRGLHRAEWQNDDDCLPRHRIEHDHPVDWWAGRPVGSRCVDTGYEGREGPLQILWPTRNCGLEIRPSDNLDHTIVYSPAEENFFCVEPVSHMTNAFNRTEKDQGYVAVDPGETLCVSVRFIAGEIDEFRPKY